MHKVFGLALVMSAVAIPASGSIAGITVINDNMPVVQGSGRVVQQSRPVSGFTRIELEGAADVEVRLGAAPSLVVSADDNILPLLTTEVRGDTLTIGSRGSYNTDHSPRYVVTVPNLAAAHSRGSGDVTLVGVANSTLELVVQGSGTIRAAGRTARLDATVQGSGDLELQDLNAQDGRVSVMGSGDALVRVAGALDASAFGSGDVRYLGRPASLSVQNAGSGRVVAAGG